MARALLLLSGLTVAAALPVNVRAQSVPPVVFSVGDPVAAAIAEAAQRFQLPEHWIRAIVRIESNGNSQALSPKGAIGLMQLMPGTWADLREHLGLGDNPGDPHDNIVAGAAYIRELFDRYGSPGWIAAYNAGPGRYEAALNGRALPAETRAYVAAIASIVSGRIAVGPLSFASMRPISWTSAPLFISQPARTTTVASVPVSRTSDDDSPAHFSRAFSAIASRSGGLFIARTGEGTAP